MGRLLLIVILLIAAAAAAVVWLLLAPTRDEPAPAPAESPASRRADAAPSDEGSPDPTPLARISPAASIDRDAPAPEQTGSATVLVEVLKGDDTPATSTLVFVGSADKHSFLGYKESLAANFGRIKSAESRPSGVQVGTTDALGKCGFHDVTPAWKLTVGAWHPQLGTVTSFGNLIRDGETKSVVLKMPGAIRMLGYVTEHDGKPVAGASVQVLGAGEQGPSSRLEMVQTDADGRYETSRWPGSGFTLVVSTSQHNDARKNVMNVSQGEVERRVDFQVERTRILRGRLVLADGSPAKVAEHIAPYLDPRDPDAHFQLTISHDNPLSRRGWLSSDRFAGEVNDRDDTYEVPLKGRNGIFVGLAFNRKVLGSASIPVDKNAPGPDIVVDWSLLPKLVPRGNLVVFVRSHADGKPLTSYTLRVEKMEADPMKRSASTFEVKSVDGRHFVERLNVGMYRLGVTANGFEPAGIETEVLADPAENEVVLRPAPMWATISGTVLRASGKPVAGAVVFVLPDIRDSDRSLGTGTLPQPVRSSAEGAYSFDRLQYGSYRILAEAEGLAPGSALAVAKPAAKGVNITLVEGVLVDVLVDGSTGPFMFFASDSSGVPVLNDVRSGTGQRSGSRFSLRLAPGRHEINVSPPSGFEGAQAFVDAVEGATVRIKLKPDK